MRHIYFREDTQELKFLPITEENCYYLGKYNDYQIELINNALELEQFSFYELYHYIHDTESLINKKMLN